MELLILKSGKAYFRAKDGAYMKCGMDAASVFPLDQKEKVAEHLRLLREQGEVEAVVCKLTIIEAPYDLNGTTPDKGITHEMDADRP